MAWFAPESLAWFARNNQLDMPQPQYNRIESGKTDPSFTTLERIAKALEISLADLFKADDTFKGTNTYDKPLIEKLKLIDELDSTEKNHFTTSLIISLQKNA